MKILFAFASALALCLAAPSGAQAQSYPSKQITIVVPVAPGGATDLLARAIAGHLGKAWGQNVIVENKPGANNQIGTDFVAKSAGDGHTLLVTPDPAIVVNPSLFAKIPYDPAKDLVPVTGLVGVELALVVNSGVPAKSVSELVALLKAKPGQYNYATFGPGSASHLIMELFQDATGTKLTPVHYRGASPALTDVAAGHVPMMFITMGLVVPQWQAGKVRPLASGGERRMSKYPDLPTLGESGVKGFKASGWFGLFAPRGTPSDVVRKINAEVRKMFADEKFKESFLRHHNFESIVSSPEDFAKRIASDTALWGGVVRSRNLRVN